MVTKHTVALVIAGNVLLSSAGAQSLGNPTRTDLGVGAAALGMANVYVAVANDISGLFWNPAAPALSKSKKAFQLSLGGLRPMSSSTLESGPAGFSSANQLTRIRIGNAGFASHSGRKNRQVAFGIAYQTPYSLDNYLDYSTTYAENGNQIAWRNQYLSVGNLDFWTAGLGFQIAQGVAIGGSLSLVTGRGVEELRFEKIQNGSIGDPYNDSYHSISERSYGGYDARIGLLFEGLHLIRGGLRIDLPSVVSFREYGKLSYPAATQKSASYVLDGYLKSYYGATAGLSLNLPLLTLAAEVNGRAPYPRVRLSEPQRYWKIGGGLGAQIDLLPHVLSARAGYAWHQYDPNPYIVTYRDPVEFDAALEPQSFGGDHLLSVGAQFRIAKQVSLDFGYAHRFWKATTGGALTELHQAQRGLAAVTVSY